MPANKTIHNINITDTVKQTGTGVQINGRESVLLIKNDHDAILDVTVEIAPADDWSADVWEVDTFAMPSRSISTSVYTIREIDIPGVWIRATAQARSSPSGGTLDIWVNAET
jgi:hypothetical protein